MSHRIVSPRVRIATVAASLAAAVLLCTSSFAAHDVTGKFQGPKANTGTASFHVVGGKRMLEVSADFVVPDTPDPHWQVVDSQGNVHLLQRMPVKGDKVNRSIVVPDYIRDVAKVQVWCAFAEVLLGEASFDRPVK